MPAKPTCPQCHGPSQWENNPYKPFCCERCRLIDLGHWLKGDYKMPDDPRTLSEEDLALLEKAETKPITH